MPDSITVKLYIFCTNKHYCQIAEKVCKINEKKRTKNGRAKMPSRFLPYLDYFTLRTAVLTRFTALPTRFSHLANAVAI